MERDLRAKYVFEGFQYPELFFIKRLIFFTLHGNFQYIVCSSRGSFAKNFDVQSIQAIDKENRDIEFPSVGKFKVKLGTTMKKDCKKMNSQKLEYLFDSMWKNCQNLENFF